jgi:L-lactate dehydrogenase complex protein LldG
MTKPSNSRQRILSKLKAQQTNTNLQAKTAPVVQNCTETHKPTKSDAQTLSDHLRKNHTEVILSTQSEWLNQLSRLIQHEQPKACLVSEHPELAQVAQKLVTLKGSPTKVLGTCDASKEALFENIEASICFAEAAAADPGCLLLIATPEQPRLLSLVPPLSIVIVRKETITTSLAELSRQFTQPKARNSSNLILVSGPSKTADIQQTLAYGAHGPKRLVVFIIH